MARAFQIFRSLGLRHLCVIDSGGLCVGICTRKNMMTYKVRSSAICLLFNAFQQLTLTLLCTQLADMISSDKVQALLRGWIARRRVKAGRDPHTGLLQGEAPKPLATTAEEGELAAAP